MNDSIKDAKDMISIKKCLIWGIAAIIVCVTAYYIIWRPIPVENIFGEYVGKCHGLFHEKNRPIGEHRIVLKSDYTYIYYYKHRKKEVFSFSGTWEIAPSLHNQIFLYDFYARISPIDYWDDYEKDARKGTSLIAYQEMFNEVTLEFCEQVYFKKVR